MPNLKDIKDRINSITSTQKITKAMKMVAAAKVKKSENVVKAGRPFAREMRNMFVRLLDGVGNDYNVSGLKIKKGKVYCWRKNEKYFYYFDTVDGKLKLVDFDNAKPIQFYQV